MNNSSTDEGEHKRKSPFEIPSEFCKRSCSNLYLDEETADVHFIFNANDTEKKIPAHKYMLAIGSPVFQSMFFGPLREEGNVTITDFRLESFVEFLQFFYLANVKLTIENASEVMNLVNKYGAIECFSVCENFLKENLSTETVIWALELAVTFDRIEFRQFVLDKIMGEPQEIFSSDSFKNCSRDILKVILECKTFNCLELLVFRACISWAQNACVKRNLHPRDMSNIRQQLSDCMYQIQFVAMRHEDLSECVSKHSELFTKEELIEIITILSVGENAELKYFVGKTRVKPLAWTDNVSMMFSTINLTESTLAQSERTSFKSNKKLLLGAIATQLIHSKTRNGNRRLNGILRICEIGRKDLLRVLSEQPFVAAVGGKYVPRNYTKLIVPIVVQPYNVYRVQIDFDSSFIEEVFTIKKCLDFNKFSIQDYTLTFGLGIISHLYFN